MFVFVRQILVVALVEFRVVVVVVMFVYSICDVILFMFYILVIFIQSHKFYLILSKDGDVPC